MSTVAWLALSATLINTDRPAIIVESLSAATHESVGRPKGVKPHFLGPLKSSNLEV